MNRKLTSALIVAISAFASVVMAATIVEPMFYKDKVTFLGSSVDIRTVGALKINGVAYTGTAADLNTAVNGTSSSVLLSNAALRVFGKDGTFSNSLDIAVGGLTDRTVTGSDLAILTVGLTNMAPASVGNTQLINGSVDSNKMSTALANFQGWFMVGATSNYLAFWHGTLVSTNAP